MADFFEHLFGYRLSREIIQDVIDRASQQDKSVLYAVYAECRELESPEYTIFKAFDAGPHETLFPNFTIAVGNFGRLLSMIHYNDVAWKGHQGGQPVYGLEGMKPVGNMLCVNKDRNIFKLGARVYKVMVFQPNCLGMGNSSRESKAWIAYDAMICDPKRCNTCTPGAGEISDDEVLTSGLPRVHHRFLGSGNVFKESRILSPKDHDEDFIEDTGLGPLQVSFNGGFRQPAIICDMKNCKGCRDYVNIWKESE